MSPNDADGMPNSVDCSYLSENLGSLQYDAVINVPSNAHAELFYNLRSEMLRLVSSIL